LQSLLAPQGLPVAQPGAQLGRAHRPATQLSEPQSESAPQRLPSAQRFGPVAHPGGWHAPAWHCCDSQSPLFPQALPSGQAGEQAGATHLPAVQICEPQSELAPQAEPSLHLFTVAAHAGGWHLPLAMSHCCDAHWLLAEQARPSAQSGAHAPQIPPVQTSVPQSPLAPHFWPMAQPGAQAGGAHLPPVQTPEAQSTSAPHVAPSRQPGEHIGGAHCPCTH